MTFIKFCILFCFLAAFFMYILILIYTFHLKVWITDLQHFSDDLSIKKRSQIQHAFEIKIPVASEQLAPLTVCGR